MPSKSIKLESVKSRLEAISKSFNSENFLEFEKEINSIMGYLRTLNYAQLCESDREQLRLINEVITELFSIAISIKSTITSSHNQSMAEKQKIRQYYDQA